MKLNNKVAVVTGGGSGIGLAIAEAFAAEGAKIALFDLNSGALQNAAKRVQKKGADVLTSVVNVTSSASVKEGFKAALREFGTVDILVNCAGIIR